MRDTLCLLASSVLASLFCRRTWRQRERSLLHFTMCATAARGFTRTLPTRPMQRPVAFPRSPGAGQRFARREKLRLPSSWDQARWSHLRKQRERERRFACVLLQLPSAWRSRWLRGIFTSVYICLWGFPFFSFLRDWIFLGESNQFMSALIPLESLFLAFCHARPARSINMHRYEYMHQD